MVVATAGWAIPKPVADAFPAEGSGLSRYATRLLGVEINTTFYRSHRRSTYEGWTAAVPAAFRFAVKCPKRVTHELRLAPESADPVAAFLDETAALGDRRGPMLVQLPPKLAFEAPVAQAFFRNLRQRFAGPVACEPRHPSWFEPEAEALLKNFGVARVGADPPYADRGDLPGGSPDLLYLRLHGSPRVYASRYEPDAIAILAECIRTHPAAERWCVFDNTLSGAAMANALELSLALLA